MSNEAWKSLSEQLDHALELSDEERQEWLNKLRDREPVLAAKHCAHRDVDRTAHRPLCD
jgi:hypothetical protein